MTAILVTVQCATRAAPSLAPLTHVTHLLTAFLDGSQLYTLAQAAATGSIALFDRVVTRHLRRLTPHTITQIDTPNDGDNCSLHMNACDTNDPALMMHHMAKAMAAAIPRGAMGIVQRIHHYHPAPLPVPSFVLAARHDQLQILQWLFAYRRDGLCTDQPPQLLARHGDLECCVGALFREAISRGASASVRVARWLFGEGFMTHAIGLGDLAATLGDLAMVTWLHERGARTAFSVDAIPNAAGHGHLQVVQYLHETVGAACGSHALDRAVMGDHGTVADYLRQTQVCTRLSPQFVVEAARRGRLDALRNLESLMQTQPAVQLAAMQAPKRLSMALRFALEHDHLDVVQWLVTKKRVSLNPSLLREVAARGQLEVIQWVSAYSQARHNWRFTGTMDSAAGNGHLELVQWLHAHRSEGCSRVAMDRAATNGHLDTVVWLHTHRTEGCTAAAMNGAARNGHLRVVEWLAKNRTEGCTKQAMDGAISLGHLEVVIWLHNHSSAGCSELALDDGTLDVVQWMQSHRPEKCTSVALDNAAAETDRALIEYLLTLPGVTISPHAVECVAVSGHLPLLEWMYAHSPESFEWWGIQQAALSNHVRAWVESIYQ